MRVEETNKKLWLLGKIFCDEKVFSHIELNEQFNFLQIEIDKVLIYFADYNSVNHWMFSDGLSTIDYSITIYYNRNDE